MLAAWVARKMVETIQIRQFNTAFISLSAEGSWLRVTERVLHYISHLVRFTTHEQSGGLLSIKPLYVPRIPISACPSAPFAWKEHDGQKH